MKKIKRILSAVTAVLCSVSAVAGALSLNVRAVSYELDSSVSVLPEITIAAEEEATQATFEAEEETTYSFLKGDANLDGMVNIRDSAFISIMEVRGEIYSLPESADFNDDGTVNIRDAAAIAYHLSGTEVVETDWSGSGSYIGVVDGECYPGETVTVELYVNCGNMLESFSVDLEYDPELTVNGVSFHNGVAGSYYNRDSECSIVGFGSAPIANGTVAAIDITVPENAVAGNTYCIDIACVDTVGIAGGKDLSDTIATVNGDIYIVPYETEATEPTEESMYKVNEGSSVEFTPKYESEDEITVDVVSADNLIAKVADNVIYGINAGITEIQYIFEDSVLGSGVLGTEKVMVKTSENLKIAVDQEKYIFASVSRKGITWKSEDESIATVNNGVVCGISKGVTKVTAVRDSDGTVIYDGTITVVDEGVTLPVVTTKATTTTTTTITTTTTTTTKTTTTTTKTEIYNDFSYIKIDKNDDDVYDYIEITGLNEEAEEVNIPGIIEGLPVESIGDNAFYDYTLITSVKIPDSVKIIGTGAFTGCEELERVTIGKNVTTIKSGAFAFCNSLVSITIPESVTVIENDAFQKCNSLENVIIENAECEIYNSVSPFSNGYIENEGSYFNGTIYGYENSTAQAHAKMHGIAFDLIENKPEEIILVPGDANGDGIVNIRDSSFIARCLAQDESDKLPESADYNEDRTVNIRDAAALASAAAKNLVEKTGGSKIERDSESSASVSLGDTAAIAGDFAYVPMNVTCNNNFESAAMIIESDLAFSYARCYGSNGMNYNSEYGEGYCTIAGFTSSPVKDGQIAELTIEIPEDTVPGTYDIYFTYIDTFAEFNGEDSADSVSVSGGTITVLPNISGIEMNVGDSLELDGDFSMIDITSKNPSVARYEDNTVYALSAGIASLEITYNGEYIDKFNITVNASENIDLHVDEQKFVFINSSSNDIVWITDDVSVAIAENGIIRGVSEGKTAVYAIDTATAKKLYTGIVTVGEKSQTLPVITTKATTTTTKATTTTVTTTTKASTTKGTTTTVVTDVLVGDANEDGILNIRDSAYMARCLAQGEAAKLTAIADYNEDGKVNIRDCAAIATARAKNLAEKVGGSKIERDNGSEVSVSLGDMKCAAGDHIYVPVEVTCNDNFESGEFIVEWDIPCEESSGISAGGTSVASESNLDYCTLAVYGTGAIEDGEIAEVTLDIPEDTAPGTYNIYFTAVDVFAEFEGEDLADSVSVSGGTITVLPSVPDEIEIIEGESVVLSDEILETYKITLSDESDILVLEENTLKAVSSGWTWIRYETPDKDYVTSTVIAIMPPSEFELQKGDTKSLDISYSFVESNLMWLSSDTSVATVTNGTVQAVSAGKAAIYAIDKSNGSYAYIGIVTVPGDPDVTTTTAASTTKSTSTSTTTVTSTSKSTSENTTDTTSNSTTSAITTTVSTGVSTTTTGTTEIPEGDANGDGELNVRDAAYIAKMAALGKLKELSLIADFNGDKTVNVRDAAAIARKLAQSYKTN